MQRLRLTYDTIFRKKIRSLKISNLYWSITGNKCKKFNLKHTIFAVDEGITMFYNVTNYATHLLAHSYALSIKSELSKSGKLFELSH